MKIVSSNKNAHFNYFILETYLAGIVLEGCEVKSIRQNGMTINESFIIFKNNDESVLFRIRWKVISLSIFIGVTN